MNEQADESFSAQQAAHTRLIAEMLSDQGRVTEDQVAAAAVGLNLLRSDPERQIVNRRELHMLLQKLDAETLENDVTARLRANGYSVMKALN